MTSSLSGPTSQTYFSQRLRLHYVDWGNHDAPPLLLVHGGQDHCRTWDWVAEALRDDYHIIAPDLRGHGDSGWAIGGNYLLPDFVYDIAQLVRQRTMAPLSIMGHSLGGYITLLYAGLYPETVSKLVNVDGVIQSPDQLTARIEKPYHERLDKWILHMRDLSGRTPRKYKTVDECVARMHEENPRLSYEQARSLTINGVNQNEDGTFSWKFDNYVRTGVHNGLTVSDITSLWNRISCPTLLVSGDESFIGDPATNGALQHFRNARTEMITGAGHWVHHDKLETFLGLVRPFLKG